MHKIKRVAILGAGTMGASLAAHCANAGLEVDLLDIASGEGDKNAVVKAGYDRMQKARPANLMSRTVAERIRLGNFEDDLGRVAEADWILEAIIERLDLKQGLFERVEGFAREDAIVSSNTSGIPLGSVAEGRSEGFRKRFVGTHFFNPPRYLKLMEIIPTGDTDPGVVERIRAFGERVWGKGGVICKDTPSFIANRLGGFAGMQSTRYAFDHGYGVEEVDAITGPLVGNPKTATFRLNDLAGLDVAVGVARNLYELVPDDESREDLRPHPILEQMVEKNLIGNKAGAGFYKRTKRDGKTVFDVLNTETYQHEPARDPEVPILKEAMKQGDLAARMRFLVSRADEDRHARFIRDTMLPYLAYASRRVPEISDTLEDVDHAMEWGYAQEAGPFRRWDMLGVRETVRNIEEMGLSVGPWVKEMLEAGNESFYKVEGGKELQFSPANGQYEPVRIDPMRLSLDEVRADGKEISRNGSASLLDLGDGVLCFEIHSKGNSIDAAVVELGNEALRRLEEEDWAGLVIGNEGRNFCVGANLQEVAGSAQNGDLDAVGRAVDALQNLLMGFRFSSKPVVAAPHGQTLGGGAEIALHADRICAAGETYMGLVEVGVGLIPAGGGTKELIRRLVSPAMHTRAPALPYVQEAFQQIALAKVSTSALEAKETGLLDQNDRVVMNLDHLISAAKREVLDLADGYAPPVHDKAIYASGEAVRTALEVGVKTLQWGRYASEYDGVVAGHLARVLTGGNLSLPQWVSEEYILRLEKEAFLELLKNEKTHERIGAMLKTGKPLRN